MLARASEEEADHRRRALRRASRAALTWPEEAADIAETGDGLTSLGAVGPWIGGRIEEWLAASPEIPDPPETRRDFATVASSRRVLAADPGWRDGFLGDLQMHTTWSDGGRSVEEMAGHARAEGRRYVAVTDHSKGLPIARGMDEAKLMRQWDEIARVNELVAPEGFHLLRSMEMNLSPEGEGDMDPQVLAGLDLVLGAFHSKLRGTQDQTDRYLAAVRNPDIHVLAHPRGRRWDTRRGLDADWPRVLEAAADSGTAVEIDAYPDRQDLQHELLLAARETDVWISIGTDAHQPWELGFFEIGMAAALRAGVRPERILNRLPVDALKAWARP